MSSDVSQDEGSVGSVEEETLFPLESEDGSDNDEFYHKNDNIPSDIDSGEDEDEGEIDDSAWGKNRKAYYSTDYVDKDFGGYAGSDAEMAEEEEKEALRLQKQITAELDNDDFGLDLFKKVEIQTVENVEKITIDSSTLSLNEKLELLKTESPELLDLIEDIRTKFNEAQELLKLSVESGKELDECSDVKLKLLLRFSVNGLYYLAMKAKRESMNNHPVKKRLASYQLLLDQINLIISNKKSEISDFSDEDVEYKQVMHENEMDVSDEEDDDSHKLKKVRFSDEDETLDEKRAINNQIAKNRGLTPRRKKEYKNPRVKHRLKYRKAKIRRKGQVREPKTEVQKYGGEISGIKVGVSKSIKFK